MCVAECLEKVEGARVDLGIVKMVGPMTQSISKMSGEVGADACSKIGNFPVEGRNLIGENLAYVPAECLCHYFETALRKDLVVLPRKNRQVGICAPSRVEEEVGE